MFRSRAFRRVLRRAPRRRRCRARTVLLGQGIPLLPGLAKGPVRLELTGQRTYASSGIVKLDYRVVDAG